MLHFKQVFRFDHSLTSQEEALVPLYTTQLNLATGQLNYIDIKHKPWSVPKMALV